MPPLRMMDEGGLSLSPFKKHCDKWKNGCGAGICEKASRVVLYKGSIPCDILFVGEAPGQSEDVLGIPFVGPAGMLLDEIVRRSVHPFSLCAVCRALQFQTDSGTCCANGHGGADESPIKCGFTNIVGCIPRGDDGNKTQEPDVESIETCAPRLQEIIDMSKARIIVCVGALPRDWLKQGFKNPCTVPKGTVLIDIHHPAAILRANVANQGLMVQTCCVRITQTIEEL